MKVKSILSILAITIAVLANASCQSTGMDRNVIGKSTTKFYRNMMREDKKAEPINPRFSGRLINRPEKGHYYEVLHGPDDKLSQIVLYSEFQGNNPPMGMWRYCYSNGKLVYIKYYSFACEPCPLKHIWDVRKGCVVDGPEMPLDAREYIKRIAVDE